jgi:hypothetical protein
VTHQDWTARDSCGQLCPGWKRGAVDLTTLLLLLTMALVLFSTGAAAS